MVLHGTTADLELEASVESASMNSRFAPLVSPPWLGERTISPTSRRCFCLLVETIILHRRRSEGASELRPGIDACMENESDEAVGTVVGASSSESMQMVPAGTDVPGAGVTGCALVPMPATLGVVDMVS